MNHHQYREWKKRQLIRQIQPQRLDLAVSKTLWLDKTEHIGHGWQTIFGLRKYLAVGFTLVILYGIRHPGKLICWSRRVVSLWGTVRIIRNTFSQK